MKNKTNSKFVVSLDFELMWGMHNGNLFDNSYNDHVLGGRKAVEGMLELFEKYGIHATWATVGLMFSEGYDDLRKFFPPENKRPTYVNMKNSPYPCLTPSVDEKGKELCFAPELIAKIKEVSGQEIASHSFSHYYCMEEGQTTEQFEADMIAAKNIAEAKGYQVHSVVFPKNQCDKEYVEVLKKLEFKVYRGLPNHWIYKIKIPFVPVQRLLRLIDTYIPIGGYNGDCPKKEKGIVNIGGTRMFRPYFKPLFFLEKFKLFRIKFQMSQVAKKGKVFHLWWHPHNIGVKTAFHLKQLEEIFSHYTKLNIKYGMKSCNMEEIMLDLREE